MDSINITSILEHTKNTELGDVIRGIVGGDILTNVKMKLIRREIFYFNTAKYTIDFLDKVPSILEFLAPFYKDGEYGDLKKQIKTRRNRFQI